MSKLRSERDSPQSLTPSLSPGERVPAGAGEGSFIREDRASGIVPGISRREFARGAATVAAVSLSPAATALRAMSGSQQETAADKQKAEASLGLTAEQARRAESKFANAIREYGDRLSAEQRQRLRRILLYNEKMLASVRAVPLQNGDPPASVLK